MDCPKQPRRLFWLAGLEVGPSIEGILGLFLTRNTLLHWNRAP